MEKITIARPKAKEFMRELHNGDIEIEVDDLSQVSDGFHTIAELYDHRITLFIALCRNVEHLNFPFTVANGRPKRCWRSRLHSDGKPAYDSWFIMGIGSEAGKQISYHIPLPRWGETDFAETLNQAPKWDGHTSTDVLERLKTL